MTMTEIPRGPARGGKGVYVSGGIMQLSSFATTKEAARVIGERSQVVLQAADRAGTIVWATGRLMDLWFGQPITVKDPETAPNFGRLWMDVRQFGYTYQGPDS
jgi:hypothetical protein